MTAETENGSKVWVPAWAWTVGVLGVTVVLSGIVWGNLKQEVSEGTTTNNLQNVTLKAHEMRLDWNDKQHAAQQLLNERMLLKVDQILEEVRSRP
jgi:hypothetical protein